jgi:hypothetical protein
MYDAIDDPYTYENSTVLVNKLELREQAELDAFEAEISSARADEPCPKGISSLLTTRPSIITSFRMSTSGPARYVPFASSRVELRFAFPRTSKTRRQGCSVNCRRTASYRTSKTRPSPTRPHIFWRS